MGWIEKIQFPWRFLPIAQVLLSLLLCMLFLKMEEEKREHIERVLLILLIVTTAQMFSGVIQERTYVEKYDSAELDSFSLVFGEYVRTGTDIDSFDGVLYANNAEIIEGYTRQGKYAIMRCETIDDSGDAWIELPIIHYKNYAAYGENGIRLGIVDGVNNVVRVMLPDDYSGVVVVTYEIPPYYKVADICSLAAVILIGAMLFLFHRKQIITIKKSK